MPFPQRRSGKGHAARLKASHLRNHSTPPGGAAAHSDSTWRSRHALYQAKSPHIPTPPGKFAAHSDSTRRSHRTLRLHHAGLATRQQRAPRGAPRRVSRSASMPDRTPSGIAKRVDRPLPKSPPAPPGGSRLRLRVSEFSRARNSREFAVFPTNSAAPPADLAS